MPSKQTISQFAPRLLAWQRRYGRHHLPWQVGDPYCVWLSEIMLQQTQVVTVLDYYPRFLAAFPTVALLAAAEQDAVLSVWQGLGYYSRARNLHKAARQVMAEFGGVFPSTRLSLETLCGVGRSTAAAIAVFAFGQRETILDGNVRRVLCRVFARDGAAQSKAFSDGLWALAETLLPENNADTPAYIQGLMDLGATVCTHSKPACARCPMNDLCLAKAQNRVAALPRKKTATKVPALPLYWLHLRRADGAVWLQKRPQQGIWGGLWCVPCFSDLAAAAAFANQAGLGMNAFTANAAIEHRLSHRLLQITPLRCALRLPENAADGFGAGEWVKPPALAEYGLPKPLVRYLRPSG